MTWANETAVAMRTTSTDAASVDYAHAPALFVQIMGRGAADDAAADDNCRSIA
jgi:hypothetical protein